MRIYEANIAYNIVQLGDVETLDEPAKVVDYMRDAVDRNPCQETFWVICLDRKNKPIGRTLVSLGTLGSTLVHPREVFKVAILSSAAAIVVAHNHPSGDPAPSAADVRVTRTLREASGIIDIPLLDHVIVGTPAEDPTRVGHYSFRDAGVL
jgi:DNA repair protein RadC